MALSSADQMPITPAEAKDVVDEVLEKLDEVLSGIGPFFQGSHQMLQQHLNTSTITNGGQLGDHVKELLTRSHSFLCEGLENELTDEDLRPSEFNYEKFFNINVDEDRLTRLINTLNAEFRSAAKLHKSPLQLSMSKGKEAFQKALDAQHARTDGVSLPSSPI
jgi:hypothetical protein